MQEMTMTHKRLLTSSEVELMETIDVINTMKTNHSF